MKFFSFIIILYFLVCLRARLMNKLGVVELEVQGPVVYCHQKNKTRLHLKPGVTERSLIPDG